MKTLYYLRDLIQEAYEKQDTSRIHNLSKLTFEFGTGAKEGKQVGVIIEELDINLSKPQLLVRYKPFRLKGLPTLLTEESKREVASLISLEDDAIGHRELEFDSYQIALVKGNWRQLLKLQGPRLTKWVQIKNLEARVNQ